VVFALNLVATIPIASFLSKAVDEILERAGDTLGSLIYDIQVRSAKIMLMVSSTKMISNAVQLITSALLLKSRQISVLQTSLIDGVLF